MLSDWCNAAGPLSSGWDALSFGPNISCWCRRCCCCSTHPHHSVKRPQSWLLFSSSFFDFDFVVAAVAVCSCSCWASKSFWSPFGTWSFLRRVKSVSQSIGSDRLTPKRGRRQMWLVPLPPSPGHSLKCDLFYGFLARLCSCTCTRILYYFYFFSAIGRLRRVELVVQVVPPRHLLGLDLTIDCATQPLPCDDMPLPKTNKQINN